MFESFFFFFNFYLFNYIFKTSHFFLAYNLIYVAS